MQNFLETICGRVLVVVIGGRMLSGESFLISEILLLFVWYKVSGFFLAMLPCVKKRYMGRVVLFICSELSYSSSKHKHTSISRIHIIILHLFPILIPLLQPISYPIHNHVHKYTCPFLARRPRMCKVITDILLVKECFGAVWIGTIHGCREGSETWRATNSTLTEFSLRPVCEK